MGIGSMVNVTCMVRNRHIVQIMSLHYSSWQLQPRAQHNCATCEDGSSRSFLQPQGRVEGVRFQCFWIHSDHLVQPGEACRRSSLGRARCDGVSDGVERRSPRSLPRCGSYEAMPWAGRDEDMAAQASLAQDGRVLRAVCGRVEY